MDVKISVVYVERPLAVNFLQKQTVSLGHGKFFAERIPAEKRSRTNLKIFAYKYNGDGSPVYVFLFEKNHGVQIRIVNSGTSAENGEAETKRAHAFEQL